MRMQSRGCGKGSDGAQNGGGMASTSMNDGGEGVGGGGGGGCDLAELTGVGSGGWAGGKVERQVQEEDCKVTCACAQEAVARVATGRGMKVEWWMQAVGVRV